MKRLLIIRHAKSSWNNNLMGDFDRPLNERGERDAPEMAHRILERGIKLDAIVSSTARRAFSTAEHFAKSQEIKKTAILSFDKLYHAPAHVFYEVIQELDDKLNTVAIFSHNPGITDFVNGLTDTRIDDMPTCGIYAIHIPIKHWTDFEEVDKLFWFFDCPKNG